MSEDHTQGTKPDQEGDKRASSNSEDKNISLDDMGIPILNQVISQQADPEPVVETAKNPNHNFCLPNNEILVKALRNQLRSQINSDIDEISSEISSTIIASITQELEKRVKTDLIEILQRNLDEMINHAINVDPKRGS